jgi:hypothetical protein
MEGEIQRRRQQLETLDAEVTTMEMVCPHPPLALLSVGLTTEAGS